MPNPQINDFVDDCFITVKEKQYQFTLCVAELKHRFCYERILAYLTQKERNQLNDFIKYNARYESFLLGRFVAKQAVCRYFMEDRLERVGICNGIFNQPVVEYAGKTDIGVSLSHSGNFGAAAAFSNLIILGVDLERVRPDIAELLSGSITCEEEKLQFGNYNKNETYAMMWASKEALSKALKTGIAVSMDIYEIDEVRYTDQYSISFFKNFHQYQAISIILGGYVLSIACAREAEYSIDVHALKQRFRTIAIPGSADFSAQVSEQSVNKFLT